MRLTVHIIRQLLELVPEHRGRRIGEETADYETHSVEHVLANIPLPLP